MTLDELKPGDAVRGFRDWGCVPSNGTRIVREGLHGLYVNCSCGQHLLDGQAGDDGHLVGMKMAQKRHLAQAQ